MSSWDKEWGMMYSGRRVFPFEVKPSDVAIEDISHSLAMQVRYNGHVNRLYTVGEHCIRISDALFRDTGDAVLALTGLLHDAGETYTGDFTRPVKNSLRAVGEMLKEAEDKNEDAIFQHFGIFDPTGIRMKVVKDYDRRIIVDEKTALFGKDKPWDWDLVPLGVPIIGYDGILYDWDWVRVKREYMQRFNRLSHAALHS